MRTQQPGQRTAEPAAHASTSDPSGLLARRWHERRPIVLTGAAVLLPCMFAALRVGDRSGAAAAMFGTLAVMLVGLELGTGGGFVAAGLALLLAALGDRSNEGPLGVAAEAIGFLAVAGVAGRFSMRLHGARAREAALLRSGLELARARSEADVAAAGAAAALRMPKAVGVAVSVDGADSILRGRRSSRSTRAAVRAGADAGGKITVFHAGVFAPEDRVALELLSLQAALAVEQLRLRRREGERVAVEAELERVRRDLVDERSAVGRMLGAQEAERRRLADTLQEQLAQLLAAVLMGLRVLQRGGPAQATGAIDALREQVADVLGELRALAGTLRPATVEHLGIEAALQAIADAATSQGRDVVVRVLGDLTSLPDALATGAYRIVEDAISASRPGALAASLTVADTEVRIDMQLPAPVDDATLAPIRSRAELLGGALDVSPTDAKRTRVVARVRRPAAPPAA